MHTVWGSSFRYRMASVSSECRFEVMGHGSPKSKKCLTLSILSFHSRSRFIRKTCHLTRWGFRSCQQGWKPARVFPISMEDERVNLQPEQVPTENTTSARAECTNLSRSYSDTVPNSPGPTSICTCPESAQCACGAEESTLISALSYGEDTESPPIAIAPENVEVVFQDEDQDLHFIKSTQQVVIS
jgi:hypothetical protein